MAQFNPRRGSMVRSGGGRSGGSDLPPMQNVIVMIDQIVIAQRGKSNPDQDYAEVYLIHPIDEMPDAPRPEFGANNEPLTKVKLKMPLPKGVTDTKRRDLFGLTQKKAGGAAMGPGSLVAFEKVWWDKKEGILKAQFSRGGPTAEEQAQYEFDEKSGQYNFVRGALKHAYPNIYACVLPEMDYKKADGTYAPSGRQEVLLADQDNAQVITDYDQLYGAIVNLLAQQTEEVDGKPEQSTEAVGTAGFQLHVRALADESLSQEEKEEFAKDPATRNAVYVVAKQKPIGEGDQRTWESPTADDMVERLGKQLDFQFGVDEGQGLATLNDLLGQTGYQVEFVPMMVIKQAQTLTPSSQMNDKGKDNSRIFAVYDYGNEQSVRSMERLMRAKVGETGGPLKLEDGRYIGIVDCAWGLANAIVERKETTRDPQTGRPAPWYATYQATVSTRPKLFALPDLPTNNMPDYHRKAVFETATQLGELKKAYFNARPKEQAAEPEGQSGPAPR
jgi:hypothetical protein